MSSINFSFDNNEVAEVLQHMIDAIKLETDYATNLANWVNRDPNLQASSSGNEINVTRKGMQAQAHFNNTSFVDLKEAFANSPKAKHTKNGGWYLIVPIGMQARTLKSNMPRSLWNQISHTEFGQTSQASDGSTNFLQQAADQPETINPLDAQFQSSNITRVAPKSGSGTRGHYIAFRTVSNKSAPNSWILGRNAFNNENTTPQQQSDIAQLLQAEIQNYTAHNNT